MEIDDLQPAVSRYVSLISTGSINRAEFWAILLSQFRNYKIKTSGHVNSDLASPYT